MKNNYTKEENEILELISIMLNSNIQNKHLTEKKITELAEKNYEKILRFCNKFAQNEKENINIRYYSLILLNILINKENGKKYNIISENVKEEIRTSCLALLGNQSDLLRQYASMVVSSLGQISKKVNQKEWPNLIPLLCNGCNSDEKKFKLSAIKTLNMIWEKFPEDRNIFSSEELILMETSLIKIIAMPPNTEIALESIKAYKTFMNYISNKYNNSDYLKNTLKLIIRFCKVNNINSLEVVKSAIHCITDITKSAYDYIEEMICDLFKFFGNLCVGKDEEIAIQSYIYFTEISSEEIERRKKDEELNEKGFYNKNYIQNNWNILLICIQNTINNYKNNKNNLNENGEYTRYKALSPLIYNISQLCKEIDFEELYNYIFQLMSDKDNLVINSGVFIFSSTFETIHEYIIIRNITKIIPFLCKYLTINCPLLNNTVGDCLKKICEKFGGIIIGDKSLFITSSYLFAKLLISQNLHNKPKISICLCIYYLCNHIISCNLQNLGLFSPYLNNLFTILDTIAYLPNSYEHNSNLSYYSFLALSKLLQISNKNDKLILQNYFQKLSKRFYEAKDISNFNNDKEKQFQFQDYLCLCLNEYINERNNNANLGPEHIIYFFKIIEKYFELRKETFENGLLSLTGLIMIFSGFKKEENENEFIYMIDNSINHIINTIMKYKDISIVKNALMCLSEIIHVSGKKIEKNVKKIIEIFKKIIFSIEPNVEILGKILLIYTNLLSTENNVIWNFIDIGLICMKKAIDICIKEHDNFLNSYFDYNNFKIYVCLNNYIIVFIEDILDNLIIDKHNLKIPFKNYIKYIIKYLNKKYEKKSFKPQDDYILSSINILINLLELYKEDVLLLIEDNSLQNLYQFVGDTGNEKIISYKIILQEKIEMIKHKSINDY